MDAVAELECRDAILDGEVVALDEGGRPSFQLLQAYEKGEQRPPLFYYVFDLLQLDGVDLRSRPVTERKEMLKELLADAPETIQHSVLYARSKFTDEPSLASGITGKQPDSRYESGRRSGAWIKLTNINPGIYRRIQPSGRWAQIFRRHYRWLLFR